MKYFFVSSHTSSKSSRNAKLMPLKQAGFEAASIFRHLIWGVWKEPASKGGFLAWYVSQKIVYIYVCSLCVPMHWALWVGDSFLLWMFPVPLNGIKLPNFQILYFDGKWAQMSWAVMVYSPTVSPLGPQLLPFRIKSIIHLSILLGN